jgi:hypothetical protein
MAVGSATAALGAQDPPAAPERESFTVRPASSEIRIDGLLDEPAWSDATLIALTHEWFPGDNTEPPVATECLVTFDDDNLFVAFRAHDPEPAKIRAYFADRDTAVFDDSVGFMVDTFNDGRRAFLFRANPLGVQLDAVVNDFNDAGEDYTWDAIWHAAGHVRDGGYDVEIRVPLKQLRTPRSRDVQTWGFLATREYPRSVSHQLRSTRNERSLSCLVCQFDAVTGFETSRTGTNLEVTPTVTASRTDVRPSTPGPLEQGREEAEIGLSTRWNVTPNVALNATLNPDFSQVEADAAQLDVNERFALFFPEKRPFFLEGADYFSTLVDVVFTRTVVDPKVGIKLTGKEGRHAFGVLAAEDDVNSLLIPGSQFSRSVSIDQEVRTGVLRYRRDIGEKSSLGAFLTRREADEYSNDVYGFDGQWFITDSDSVRFLALDSRTDYPDGRPDLPGDPIDGGIWVIDYLRRTRNWFVRGLHASFDAGARTDAGFNAQVDLRQTFFLVRRFFWGEESKWYRRFTVQVDSVLREDQGGNLLDRGTNLELQWEGPRQTEVEIGIRSNREAFLGNEFNNFRRDLRIESRPSGDFSWGFFWRGGEQIDFTNVRQADFELFQPTVQFRLSKSFVGSFDHIFQVFDNQESQEYLRVNLSQTNLIYHLNAKTFFRAIFQYQWIKRDPALYEVPVSERLETLFTQLLFSYKLNPQTVLFVGYSDNHAGNEFIDLTQNNRTFYVKLGYAWLP